MDSTAAKKVRSSRARARSEAIQIVATPGSANGRALQAAHGLKGILRARGHRVQLESFSSLEELHDWATAGRTSFSLLVCFGGDGTLDTAARAAVRRSASFLSVPCGFGNLFARALGHSDRLEQVVDLIEHGEVIPVDVGVRNGATFLCHESFGFLSEIQGSAEDHDERRQLRWRRWLGYYGTAVRHLRKAPLPRLGVTVDGVTVARDATIVTVANVETYGGLLMLTPKASPIDGLFDVFVMRGTSKREILTRLVASQLRVPGALRGATLVQGRHVTITCGHQRREEIELKAGALPVLVSSRTARCLERSLARVEASREVA